MRNSIANFSLNTSMVKTIESSQDQRSLFLSQKRQPQKFKQSIISNSKMQRQNMDHSDSRQQKSKMYQKNALSKIYSANTETLEQKTINLVKSLGIFPQKDQTGHYHGALQEYFRNLTLQNQDGLQQTDIEQILVRLSRKKFKNHLLQFYSAKIVEKILKYFDFKKDLSFEQFLNKTEQLILKPNCSQEEQIRSIKEFAFHLFDCNNDGQICEYDMFNILKQTNNDVFSIAIQQDVKDISERIKFKKMFQPLANSKFEQTLQLSNKFKIMNLNKFLEERQTLNGIHKDFLSVFTTPRGAKQRNFQSLSNKDKRLSDKIMENSPCPVKKQKDSLFQFTQVQEKSIFKKHKYDQQPTQNSSQDQNLVEPKERQRKNSLGQLVQKVQDIYQTQDLIYIHFDEFQKEINFKHGIPLIALHLIQVLTGNSIIEKLQEQINVQQSINILNTFDESFVSLRQQINEQFYEDYLVEYFNRVEGRQYISKDSMMKNMHELFGVQNDYFGEMIYKYLSNGAEKKRISLLTWLQKFKLFWPKKQDDDYEHMILRQNSLNYYQKCQQELEKILQLNKIAFEILDFDKDGILSVLDLIRIQDNFSSSSELAIEMNKIMEMYKNKNIRPKNVRNPFVFDFDSFNSIIHSSCIIKELQYALVDQFTEMKDPNYKHIYEQK
eukprot:403335227